jgi:trans-2,3-dihydro-3-hydroxyanthranilate isomerase
MAPYGWPLPWPFPVARLAAVALSGTGEDGRKLRNRGHCFSGAGGTPSDPAWADTVWLGTIRDRGGPSPSTGRRHGAEGTGRDQMRYRIVDVFSATPLAGNALCVVLGDCPEERMGPIAREVNLSETTFPSISGPSSYRNRIFTPSTELPFAGHPSIGTAWTLGPGRWEQTTSGAVVTVDADAGGAVMTQPDPTITEADSHGAAAALGLPGVDGAFVAAAAGNRFLVVPTSADLAGASPDARALSRLAAASDALGVCGVRLLNDRELHVRAFFAGAGVAEDPGTGSAAGPIGVLARRLWATSVDLTVRQGDEIGRPCRIEVHAEEGNIRVGGSVVACAEGEFLL